MRRPYHEVGLVRAGGAGRTGGTLGQGDRLGPDSACRQVAGWTCWPSTRADIETRQDVGRRRGIGEERKVRQSASGVTGARFGGPHEVPVAHPVVAAASIVFDMEKCRFMIGDQTHDRAHRHAVHRKLPRIVNVGLYAPDAKRFHKSTIRCCDCR